MDNPSASPPSAAHPVTPPVVRPSLAIFGGLVGSLLGSVVARAFMARALEPADLGALFFALAWASALGGSASLGLSAAAGRRIAELRSRGEEGAARRAARTAAALALATGAAAAAVLAFAAPFLAGILGGDRGQDASLVWILRAVAPVALVLPVGLAAVGISRGFGRASGRSLIRDGGGGAFRAAAVGVAVVLGFRVAGVALAFALAVVAAETLFVLWCVRRGWLRRAGGEGRRGDRVLIGKLRPFALLELLNQVRQWMDILVLGALAAPAAVGFFGIARSVSRALDMTFRAPAHAFLPSATEAAQRGDEALFGRVYRRTRLIGLALLWPPLGVCLLVPELPVLLLAGAEYVPAAPLLRLLALAVLLDALVAFMDLALVARGRERTVAWLQSLSLVLTLGALLVMVPARGAEGAALALVAMELLRGTALAVLLVRHTPLRRWGDHLPAPLLAALAILAVGGLLLARTEGLSLLARTAVAVVVSGGGGLGLVAALLRRRDEDPGAPNSRME